MIGFYTNTFEFILYYTKISYKISQKFKVELSIRCINQSTVFVKIFFKNINQNTKKQHSICVPQFLCTDPHINFI